MPQAQPPAAPRYPANDFVAEHLPDWLKRATPQQLKTLRASVTAHLASQARMAALVQRIIPLGHYAKNKLEPALSKALGVALDLDTAVWREARLVVSSRPFDPILGLLPPDFSVRFSHMPLLQKLLQNFTDGETFAEQTAVLEALPAPGGPANILTSNISDLVATCRNVDVGATYQVHLASLLNQDFVNTLAQDKRLELALAAELAALQGHLDEADLGMLREVGQGRVAQHGRGWNVAVKGLMILGCRVDGGIVFELSEPARRQSDFPYGPPNRLRAVIVYLPKAKGRPLQRFDDWDAVNQMLVEAVAGGTNPGALDQRIALNERARYKALLSKRLSDDKPDLQPTGVTARGDVFSDLADWHVRRVKEDARFLAVPNAQIDTAASSKRLADLEAVGLGIVNLAGLLVPAIGAVLLAGMAGELLSHVYEGVSDWSQGHQHEALEHMMEVAVSVALSGALVLGAHTARSLFVEALEPVNTQQGLQRLWQNRLEPYRKASAGMMLRERPDGLFEGDDNDWWHNDGAFYAVRRDRTNTWRLLHLEQSEAFGPALRSNSERGWWLSLDRPREWQGSANLLTRLWPAARAVDAGRVAQILQVAAFDEARLRTLLIEHRPLPVALRDTLERFAVQAQNEAFFALTSEGEDFLTRLQWCSSTLGLEHLTAEAQLTAAIDNADRLRQPMLEHFAEQYLPDDPGLALVARHFPSLPTAYALDVLKDASVSMRQIMLDESRLPLALLQRARGGLQEARLVRMREALYLRGSYSADLVSLAFSLLQRQGLATDQLNLVLRERSSGGATLERLRPTSIEQTQRIDMAWENGRFALFDETGRRSELEIAEPQGLFEVLATCLAPSFLQKLGWTGADVPGAIRSQMQSWLPVERKSLLALLGWREARPLGASLQRLEDGRMGYPLGPVQSCMRGTECPLRRRIRSLYPSFNEADVDSFRELLYQHTRSPYSSLLRQEREYDRLDQSLSNWSQHPDPRMHEQRVRACREFRQAWRMEGLRFPSRVQPGWTSSLSVVSLPLGELPEIPAGTDYGHVSHLTLVNLGLSVLPPGFLANFTRLQVLNLSYNDLELLPEGLEALTHLRELTLAGNALRFSADQAAVLERCTRLRHLDVSHNPIGSTALRFGGLTYLETLNLRSTSVGSLPEGLEHCSRLTYIDVRNNHVEDLPQTLLATPVLQRQTIALSGNPLSAALIQRLQPAPPVVAPEPAASRGKWLGTLDLEHVQAAQRQWDALRAVAGGDAFFGLLDELTESADYQAVPQDIGRRVWAVISAASSDERLRQDLFDLAADPRTCADSVAHCFSQLEVSMHVSQCGLKGDPAATATQRLRLAQRLFRLEKVNRLARTDIKARYADGRWKKGERDEEEVEVSLAYRTGLAERLNLLGQPQTMLFEALAEVTQADLDAAYVTVIDAESSEERIAFISTRDFWIAALRAVNPEAFAEIEESFNRKWEIAEENAPVQQEGLGDPLYLARAKRLRKRREKALDGLAKRLTREALQAPAQALHLAGQTGHPD